MPNNNYLRGREAEWTIRRDLQQVGYKVIRASASQGFADVVGKQAESGETVWVQAKRGGKPSPCEYKTLTENTYHPHELALVLWYPVGGLATVLWCNRSQEEWPDWFGFVRWIPPPPKQMRLRLGTS